jgi:hypothetical protein
VNPAAWWALGICWPFVVGAAAVLISKRLRGPADEDCGCHWVPCDEHAHRLLRILRKEGDAR